jgi:hypothetical protein
MMMNRVPEGRCNPIAGPGFRRSDPLRIGEPGEFLRV